MYIFWVYSLPLLTAHGCTFEGGSFCGVTVRMRSGLCEFTLVCKRRVSVEGDLESAFWLNDSLLTITMWRKLFASVPAFRALKATCRSFKSSRRSDKDVFEGKTTIHLVYAFVCFFNTWGVKVKPCQLFLESNLSS